MTRTDLVCLSSLALLCTALSWHSTGFGFTLDDYSWLEAGRYTEASLAGYLHDGVAGFLRPVATSSYVLMQALFGTCPEPQHGLNILLHVACTCLTYLFLRCLGLESPWCLAGAAIFATHPAHDEVIAWVSARTSSLMTLMTLGALIAWIRWPARPGLRVPIALGCQAVAVLSKEDAVVIPAAFIALDWIVRGVPLWTALRKAAWPVALCIAYLGLRLYLAPAADRTLDAEFGLARLGLGVATRFPELFLPRRALPALLLHGLVMSGLAFVMLRARGSDRRAAWFGVTLSALALLPSSALSFAYSEDRYRYLAAVGAALVWCCFMRAGQDGMHPRAATILKWSIAPLLCLQSYRLVRDMRYWDNHAQHQQMSAAAADIAPRLRAALAQGQTLALGNTPLAQPHMRSLLVVYAGVAQSEISESATTALRLDWNTAAGEFELRAR